MCVHAHTRTRLLFIYNINTCIISQNTLLVLSFHRLLLLRTAVSVFKLWLKGVFTCGTESQTQVMNFIKTFSMAANHRYIYTFYFSELALCVLWYSVFMPEKPLSKILVREWTSWFTILNHEPIWTIHWFIASKVWFIWESGISFDSNLQYRTHDK